MHPAYILHARPYRETSLLLEAFTRDHGRIGVIARGVRGAKGQALRAVLQPFQPLLLAWGGRGDLMRMTGAEPAGAALALEGSALLSAFYLNELVLRLLPRGEAQIALFWRYAECLGLLAEGAHAPGWELRRFERDLLAGRSPAIQLNVDATQMTQAWLGAAYIQAIVTTEVSGVLGRYGRPSASPARPAAAPRTVVRSARGSR